VGLRQAAAESPAAAQTARSSTRRDSRIAQNVARDVPGPRPLLLGKILNQYQVVIGSPPRLYRRAAGRQLKTRLRVPPILLALDRPRTLPTACATPWPAPVLDVTRHPHFMDPPDPALPSDWAARLFSLLPPVPFVALVAALLAPRGATTPLEPGARSTSLVRELRARHLEASDSDVHWVDMPHGAIRSRFERARAVVRARLPGERWDVYLVTARVSPEGSVLSVDGVFDLTRTSAVGEELVSAAGGHAGWVIGGEKRYYRVETADLDAARRPSGEEWTRLPRLQYALTNLQRTGQLAGIGRRSFKLDPAAEHVSLSITEARLVVVADEHRIAIPWDRSLPIDGGRFVREEERELARPGNLVTWAVDRARDLSWFGDERMQFTKAVAYTLLDRVDRLASAVRAPDTSEPAVAELGDATGGRSTTVADPEIGFPPPPIPPLVTPPLPDEGAWFSLANDPFVHGNPGIPGPLVTTYLRADGARPDSRVIVVTWDPRQVELDVVPGTEEPQSATGETGTGMIPRKPEIMSRLLGAFNGAFQSTHGDFGMKVDGEVIVPPKPYAATVVRMADGATGFGTWPYDLTIPADFASFRQNLTPLVEDGKLNPYGRDWWGGVPHDWEDETHTVRTGLCLTHEGFIAYFYGTKVDHVHLGRAMLAARCDYGLHLDMNQGHTGLELYRVYRDGELPSLSDKSDGHWQTEGDVLDMPGFKFRGRRLVRNMQLMHFPRYIRRGARDYFYLLLRPMLPGPPLAAGAKEGDEGAWTIKGLPQLGFPYALATTSVRPDPARAETKVRVLKFDPTVVRPARDGDGAAESVLAIDRTRAPGSPASNGASLASTSAPTRGAESPDEAALWLAARRAVIASQAPDRDAVRISTGITTPNGPAVAALGVDLDGMVVYAEVATVADPSRDAALLAMVLKEAHCGERLFLRSSLVVALGGVTDLAGHPVRLTSSAIRLVRERAERARRLFPETPILAPGDWTPLQRQTRWFPKEVESAAPPSSSPSAER
jgi:hypothetical protein